MLSEYCILIIEMLFKIGNSISIGVLLGAIIGGTIVLLFYITKFFVDKIYNYCKNPYRKNDFIKK